jgi:hypothetical protein
LEAWIAYLTAWSLAPRMLRLQVWGILGRSFSHHEISSQHRQQSVRNEVSKQAITVKVVSITSKLLAHGPLNKRQYTPLFGTIQFRCINPTDTPLKYYFYNRLQQFQRSMAFFAVQGGAQGEFLP